MTDIRNKVLLSDQITPFQKRVYLALLEVPSGATISYGELARRIGCRSAQAVGQALKRNPFAPDVPCHRVVAADGSLGGYNGRRDGEQLERKRQLLEKERIDNRYIQNNYASSNIWCRLARHNTWSFY